MKRLVDFVLAGIALLMFAPVLCLLWFMVRMYLGAPVLFTQYRPGLNGKPFRIIKFRTMTDKRDVYGNLLADAERLPPLGHFLRATSLDELPELWNVLKGEMSLVGPRPLLMEYLPLYDGLQRRR